MKVKQIKETIAEWSDDDEIFVCFFSKEEADEHATDALQVKQLTDKEWLYVIDKLNNDEPMWAEIMSAFRYHIEAKTIQRLGSKRKVRFNVNSK